MNEREGMCKPLTLLVLHICSVGKHRYLRRHKSKVVIIILVLVAVILLVFRSGMLGPFIGLNAAHSVENEFDCGFILEEGNLKLNTPRNSITVEAEPLQRLWRILTTMHVVSG